MSGMWMDETGVPDDQPAGFAAPDAVPLGGYSTTATASSNDVPAPVDYVASGYAGPDLATIAPAPAPTRDPSQPFEAGQDDQLASVAERDPREPFPDLSPQNVPDFAPPTGAPVTSKWAPPTGSPAYFASTGAYPVPGAQQVPGRPRRGGAIVAEYWATDAFGKLAIVLKALPWPVLLILIVGAALMQGAFAIWGICIAFLVCSANAKIAQATLNRAFGTASAVYIFFWLATLVSQATNWGYAVQDAYLVIGRWLCIILLVAAPIIVWRAFERER